MGKYSNFEEINTDLKVYDLKRKIAVQEIKNIRAATGQALSPSEWLQPTIMSAVTKFSKFYFLKKLFK